MFWTGFLSIIRNPVLHTQQCHTGYAECLLAGSGWNWVPTCPKHAGFYSKNKFEKLVHLVGFIIRKVNQSDMMV